MAKKLEEVLLPHEVDKDGKKLETPGEVDVEAIRAWAHGLVVAQEAAEDEKDQLVAAKQQSDDALTELQRKNETDEQRRAREQEQRDQELAELRKTNQERAKVDAIAAAFEKEGITSAQARKLATRVKGDKETDWVQDARELVGDGFVVGEKKAADDGAGGGDGGNDDLSSQPRVTRNGRVVPPKETGKAKSVAEELDAAGIGNSGW